VTTPDETLAAPELAAHPNLIDMSADFGAGGVLVFGSPKQRSIDRRLTREQATAQFHRWTGGGGAAGRGARGHDSAGGAALQPVRHREPPERDRSDRERDREPAIRTMFDVHNTLDETEPHSVLIERHFEVIRHVHVNEMDGKALRRRRLRFQASAADTTPAQLQGWVSLERSTSRRDRRGSRRIRCGIWKRKSSGCHHESLRGHGRRRVHRLGDRAEPAARRRVPKS
jgi:hypothetical protein